MLTFLAEFTVPAADGPAQGRNSGTTRPHNTGIGCPKQIIITQYAVTIASPPQYLKRLDRIHVLRDFAKPDIVVQKINMKASLFCLGLEKCHAGIDSTIPGEWFGRTSIVP